MRKIVIAGHSHTIALGVPPHERDTIELVQLSQPHDRAEFLGLVGPAVRPLSYWDKLAEVAPGKTVALCIYGSQHYIDFMFEREPFDFVPRSRPNFAVRGFPLVPKSLIRAHFAPSLALLDEILKRLAAIPDARSVVLGTPPPRRNNESALATARFNFANGAWVKSNGHELDDLRILDDFVLLKLWTVIQDMMRESADHHAAQFIEVPPQTQDECGALLRQYWQLYDFIHANQAYGRVFLDHITDRLAA